MKNLLIFIILLFYGFCAAQTVTSISTELGLGFNQFIGARDKNPSMFIMSTITLDVTNKTDKGVHFYGSLYMRPHFNKVVETGVGSERQGKVQAGGEFGMRLVKWSLGTSLDFMPYATVGYMFDSEEKRTVVPVGLRFLLGKKYVHLFGAVVADPSGVFTVNRNPAFWQAGCLVKLNFGT